MKLRLILIFIFNVIDILATYMTTQELGFVEVNPIANSLLQVSPRLFVFIKSFIVSILLVYLWYNKAHKLARLASWIALMIYGPLVAYYIVVLIFHY